MDFPKNTALVLGAGASHPYGFPLGKQLKDLILNLASAERGSKVRKTFTDAGYTDADVESFRESLRRAYIYKTIDQFLENRDDQRSIACFALAWIISSFEEEYAFTKHEDWYGLLAASLKLGEPDIPANVSAIITFNYDRSLEYYLRDIARHAFCGVKMHAACRKLGGIPFFHVHGCLGELDAFPYRPSDSGETLLKLSNGIRLIHEDSIERDETFVKAKNCIANADHVMFLGWSYDERGLRRLGLRDIETGTKRLSGTAFQYSGVKELQESFGNKIYLENESAFDFLRKFNSMR